MGIAKLMRVILASPRRDLGILLSKLCEFSHFHPSDSENLVEDLELLEASSHAHYIFSEANELLAQKDCQQAPDTHETRQTFAAKDIFSLLERLSQDLSENRAALQMEGLSEAARLQVCRRLRVLREAALMVFNNLRRVKLAPGLRRTVVTEGFIPSDRVESLNRHVGEYVVSLQPVRKTGPGEPYMPSLLVNRRVASLFENITLLHGLPRYNEIDPTPIIAFIFPLFFGMMFADVGRGTTLLIVGLVLALRREMRWRYWGRILTVFGISALVTGTITGTVFGVEFSTPLPELIRLPEGLVGPLTAESALLMLQVGAIIGSFHLASAYGLAVANKLRSHNFLEALLGDLPTLLLYSSAILFVLSLFGAEFQWTTIFVDDSPTPVFSNLLGWYVPVHLSAIISFPTLTVSFLTLIGGRPIANLLRREGRKAVRSLGVGLLEAFMRPMEFLANTVSYMRLGALLVVGRLMGSLSSAVLSLGLVGVLLAVLVNLGLMVIEGLMVYIQDLRLHLYEWSSKFYSGLGVPFTPLVMVGETCEFEWFPGGSRVTTSHLGAE